jgi:glutamate transport system permease protein
MSSVNSSLLFDVPGPHAQARNRGLGIVSTLVVAGVTVFVVVELWSREAITPDQFSVYADPQILSGLAQALGNTLAAAGAAIASALLLGGLLCAGRLSRAPWIHWPAVAVIEFFRAIPLVLLILFLFLGFGQIIGTFGALVAGLMLYNGSVLAEIFRAGILAVPRGQSEAGYALGLTNADVMRHVVAPQALRAMAPSIVSQCVVALKDTSLGFIISYLELARFNRLIYTAENNIIASTLVVTVVYVAMNLTLSWLADRLARRSGRTQERALDPDMQVRESALSERSPQRATPG